MSKFSVKSMLQLDAKRTEKGTKVKKLQHANTVHVMRFHFDFSKNFGDTSLIN